MHDFTAPRAGRLAAALHRRCKEPVDVDRSRASRDAEALVQPTQLDDWEHEGGAIPPAETDAGERTRQRARPAKTTRA
jgi:hypothetical protein